MSAKGMRRVFASFVLSAMGWSLVAPIALAATATAVQACCRRDGKHHCMSAIAVASGTSGDDKLTIRGSQSSCPYSAPIILATFQGLHATKFVPASCITVGYVAASALDRGCRVAAREWSARGPPVSLL
jgi:hypothetical protein